MLMGRVNVAAVIAAFLLAACQSGAPSGSAAPSQSSAPEAKQYRIGSFALVPFTQLQDMIEGFKESATACGLVEGSNTTYFIDFAQGQESALQLLAKRDLDNKVDLFVALDTPSMITMASLSKTVPIVAVAPSFPTQSGVVKSLDAPGGNVTGGSDYIDPAVTLSTMLKVLPNVKRIGIIYNPSEQNSSSFEEAIRKIAPAQGVTLDEVSITSTSEIQVAARGLVGRVDAILLGPDNTAISAAAEIAQISNANKIPLVSYVSGVAVKGALMDLGVSYLYLGQQAGKQACDILTNGANPATMPFTTITNPSLTINTDVVAQLGVTIAPDVLSKAETVKTGS